MNIRITARTSTLAALLLSLCPTLSPTLLAKDASTHILPGEAAKKSPVKYPEDFEAEIEMVSKDLGGKAMTLKVFKLGDQQRIELSAMGQEMITLVDGKSEKATTMVPSQKLATIMSLNSATMPLDLSQLNEESGNNYKEVGREKIGEVDTIKYEVSDANGKKTADLWASTETTYPVKLVPANGETSLTWKKLSETKPDAALFTVPSDYKVIDMGKIDPAMLNGLKDMLNK